MNFTIYAGLAVVAAAALHATGGGTTLQEEAVTEARHATETPAERAIAVARAALARTPSVDAHNALALALSRRARETADPAWYDRSDTILSAALELAAGNFEAQKLRVWNQLGRHEFGAAYAAAQALLERSKDDVLVYGLIVDAAVELGLYAEAEEAAQWMLNLRQGTPAAMTRVSYLRELYGDIDGAVQAMQHAFHSTRPTESEDLAWMLAHLAHLELERGRAKEGGALAQQALELFPDYHYALAEAARAHALRGEWPKAIERLERRHAVAPHPENLFDVAVAVAASGDRERAGLLFTEFEAAALAEAENVDNANLQLAEYWLDHTEDTARWQRALDLTSARHADRKDVPTLELHGWALFRNGRVDDAREVLGRALEVGSVNARLRHRAGQVLAAAGLHEEAREQMELTYRQSPASEPGRAAREWLMPR